MPDAVVKIKAEAAGIHSPKPHHTHRLWSQGLRARLQTQWRRWYDQGPRMGAVPAGPHNTGWINCPICKAEGHSRHCRKSREAAEARLLLSHTSVPPMTAKQCLFVLGISEILLLRPLLDHLSLFCDPHKPVSHTKVNRGLATCPKHL